MTETRPQPSLPLQRLTTTPLESLSDDLLLARLAALLAQSRRVEADLVAHIGEVDVRRLYRREAAPSRFAYCTAVLRLSEHEAYLRITVARAAREHPLLLDMLGCGRLHLSGAAKLATILTLANRDSVLERAAGRSKREIEELVAELAPQPSVPASIRRLPERPFEPAPPPLVSLGPGSAGPARAGAGEPAEVMRAEVASRPLGSVCPTHPDRAATHPARPLSIQPLSPDRYKVQFTASRAFRDQLERLRALMRTTVPDGDLAAILQSAVSEKLQRLVGKRFAKTERPRSVAGVAIRQGSRSIPAGVRRAVHERDQGRCRFVSAHGQRCRARERLEFHHVHPWAYGGDRSVANVRLMCRAHNALLAEHDYGPQRMARYRKLQQAPEGRTREPP